MASASCSTPQFGGAGISVCPQLKLTVTTVNQVGTVELLNWKLEYVAYGTGANTSYAKVYTAVVNGQTVASGSYNINGVTSTRTIKTGSISVNRAKSPKSIPFSCSMGFNLTWSGVYAGTKSASGSVSITAIESHTIKYNANGGTGAPAAQTKWWGEILTLSSAKPTRTGYSFQGWSTSSSSSTVSYRPGQQYGEDVSRTLYAVWKANTYTVSYNANGGTGAPGAQTKTYGVTLKLSSTKPTRTNYNFKGWGTSASSTTVAYAPGANYTANSAITLYAIWELAYTKPRISIFEVSRSNSDGAANDAGTSVKYRVKWATDRAVDSVLIDWKLSSASSYGSAVDTVQSGTSGDKTGVVGIGAFNADNTYDIRVRVTDSGGTTSAVKTISGQSYLIDFLPGASGGTAIGKAAETADMLDVNYRGYFRKHTDFKSTIKDRFNTFIGNGLTTYESAGIDPNTTTEHLILTNHANRPATISAYWYIMTFFYSTKSSTSNKAQFAMPYSTKASMYHRYCHDGTWGAWRRLVNDDEKIFFENYIKDYIVSRGTTSIWTWEKWNSGKAECWGKHNVGTLAFTAPYGSWYEATKTASANFPSGLFKSAPSYFNAHFLNGDKATAFVEAGYSAPSATNTGVLYLAKATKDDSMTNATLAYHAIGVWK